MRPILLLVCVLFTLLSGLPTLAQQATFTAPDTVCVNEPVNLNNTSAGGSSFYWNFCSGDIYQPPTVTNLGDLNGNLYIPVFMEIAKEGQNYYGFIVNNSHSIVRLDFGNSLLNTPTTWNFGNVGGLLPTTPEGLQIVQDANGWHVLVTGGNTYAWNANIAVIHFGASLSNNNPTCVNWGNIGTLAYPTDLYAFQENGNWYAYTLNSESSTITRLSFGTSFNATPTGVNLGNLGSMQYPTGFGVTNVGGNWYMLVANTDGHTISRLDFGNSLLNTPAAVNLGNVDGLLNKPRDVTIYSDCSGVFALIANGDGDDIVRLNFAGGNITGAVTATTYGNVGGNLRYPHCLSGTFRVQDDMYVFVANAFNHTLQRLQFSACTNNIPSSSLNIPPAYGYSQPGTYKVEMIMNEGTPLQRAACREIVVVPPPVVDLGVDPVNSCNGTPVVLNAGAGYSSYHWSDNSSGATRTVDTSGIYSVTVTNGGACSVTDDIKVNISPTLDATVNSTPIDCHHPTGTIVVTPSGGMSPFTYTVNGNDRGNTDTFPQLAKGDYTIEIKDSIGCAVTKLDSVILDPDAILDFAASFQSPTCNGLVNGGITVTVNDGQPPFEFALGNTPYQPNTTFPNLGRGTYKIYGRAGTCEDSAEVTITEPPAIDLTVTATDATCGAQNGSLVINVTGGTAPYAYVVNGSSVTPADLLKLKAGNYTATIVDANGCLANTSTFTLDNLDFDFTVAALPPTCNGLADGAINVTVTDGQAPFQFAIDNTPYQNGTTFRNLEPGTYKVYGRGNSCVDSAEITIVAPAAIDLGITSGNETCGRENGSLTLTGTGGTLPYTFEVNGVRVTPTDLRALHAGDYTVTIIDANGCRVTETATLNNILLPPVRITNRDTTIALGEKIELHAVNAIDYFWHPGEGLSCVQCQTTIAQPTESTTYIVYTMNGANCVKSDTVTVYVDKRHFLFIPTAFTPNKDGLNDVFRVKGQGVASFNMHIYNRWGQLIFRSADVRSGWDGTYIDKLQPSGSYVYRIEYSFADEADKVYQQKGAITLVR